MLHPTVKGMNTPSGKRQTSKVPLDAWVDAPIDFVWAAAATTDAWRSVWVTEDIFRSWTKSKIQQGSIPVECVPSAHVQCPFASGEGGLNPEGGLPPGGGGYSLLSGVLPAGGTPSWAGFSPRGGGYSFLRGLSPEGGIPTWGVLPPGDSPLLRGVLPTWGGTPFWGRGGGLPWWRTPPPWTGWQTPVKT